MTLSRLEAYWRRDPISDLERMKPHPATQTQFCRVRLVAMFIYDLDEVINTKVTLTCDLGVMTGIILDREAGGNRPTGSEGPPGNAQDQTAAPGHEGLTRHG